MIITHPHETARLAQAEAEARRSVVLCWSETLRARRIRYEQQMAAARASLALSPAGQAGNFRAEGLDNE